MTRTRVEREEVARVFLFSRVNDAILERITAAAFKLPCDRGDVLFNFGDEITQFYYVVHGTVQLSRASGSGDEKVIALINAGETFAEALIFGPAKNGYPVDARMIEGGELIAFDIPTMREILAESTEACFSIMASMSKRLHELVIQIEDISLHNATYRLVNFLLGQLSDPAQKARGFQLSVPKLVIASRLSIKPETFSRILTRLRNDGLIESDGAHVVLKDVRGLSELVKP